MLVEGTGAIQLGKSSMWKKKLNNTIEQFTDVIGRFSFDFTVIVT